MAPRFTGLLRSLEGLGDAKRHLFGAGREVLLLAQSLLKVADDYAAGLPGSRNLEAVRGILTTLRQTAGAAVRVIPGEATERTGVMYGLVIGSLLEVIDGEIADCRKSHRDRMRKEALESIRDLLKRELGKKGQENHAAA